MMKLTLLIFFHADYQYGGRNGRGTDEALSDVWENIQMTVSIYNECNTIFLDISKGSSFLGLSFVMIT